MASELSFAALWAVFVSVGCASTSPAGAPQPDASGSAGAFQTGGTGGGIDVEPTGGGGSGQAGSTGAGGAGCQPPAPVSGAVHTGDLYVSDAASALTARSLTEITGALRVMPSFSGDLELPNLIALGGSLIVESVSPPLVQSQITRLRAQSLRRIGGDLWLYLNVALLETDFWKLETIGGRLYIHRNTVLERIGMDSLAQVGSTTQNEISSNSRLPDCLINAVYSRVGWSGSSTTNGGSTRTCQTTSCGRLVPAPL